MKLTLRKRFFLLWALCLTQLNAQQLPVGLTDLEAYVGAAMAEWKIPGLSLAIVHRGKLVYAKGFGVREIGKPEKVDPETIFAVGSNTKAFTALMVSQLAYEGKLSLEDPVQKHLPYFTLNNPHATALVTVRDLLCHRIGLGTWHGDLVAWGSRYDRTEILRRYQYIKPIYGFRSGFGYQNVPFMAAGELAGAAAGSSWDEWVVQRIFRPLDMFRSATKHESLQEFENVAMPHTINIEGQLTAIPYRNINNIGPAGSITSSAGDMARWLMLQADSLGKVDGKEIFKRDVIRRTHYPNNLIAYMPYDNLDFPETHLGGYALGWFIRDYHGKVLFEHGGGVDGMISQTGFMPELNLGWVILSNLDTGNSLPTALMYYIVDAYLNRPRKDWSKYFLDQQKQQDAQNERIWRNEENRKNPEKKPSFALASMSGVYENELYGQIQIEILADKIQLHLLAHPGIVGILEHWHNDRFLVRFNDPEFGRTFIPFKAEKGEVKSFTIQIRPDFLDPLVYAFTKKVE